VTDAPSTMPRRYLALWFPFLPAERLRRLGRENGGGPDERPLVLVEKVKGALRLAAVEVRALKLGLTPGLTLADARARVPGLAVAEQDLAADAAFLERLAEDSDRWTPLVAIDGPAGLLLDITGCSHLFGEEAPLRARIKMRLERIGLTARATIAGTPDSARALARYSRVGIVPPGGDARAVKGLPVAALGAAPEVTVALTRAGLKTIGHLADRPSLPLSARFGEELNARLRRVLGREDIRITPRRPLPACVVDRPFSEPIARVEDVERTLGELVGEAACILEQRGEGGRMFEASFFRTDGAVRRITVATGRASRDAGTVLRLYRERLDSLADPIDPGFGFDLIRLAVPVSEPLATTQGDLGGRTPEDDQLGDLVDRLAARFGSDRVLRFVARDTHAPERAARLVPAPQADRTALRWPAPEPEEPPGRPLRIFDPPQPIETLAEVPDGPPIRFRWRRVLHEIARAEGPERIAPEWWRRRPGAPTRDYFRVEDVEGRRFWVFRSGLYGRETEQPRWFLHGLFP
jgi:protein ImuB